MISALSWPLRRDGRVIGTLSLLGKVARDALTSESFSAQDQALLGRFAEHAQQALEQVGERERMRHQRRFDDLTGLPNATHVGERIEEEIARSSARGRSFALVRFRLDGLADLLARRRARATAERLVVSLAQELRAGLREFDIVARTAPDTFLMLIPEPESDVSALLGPLARRVREAIRREPDPVARRARAARVRLRALPGRRPDLARAARGDAPHARHGLTRSPSATARVPRARLRLAARATAWRLRGAAAGGRGRRLLRRADARPRLAVRPGRSRRTARRARRRHLSASPGRGSSSRRARAPGSRASAPSTPRRHSSSRYGNVALLSASVDVRGTAPGMFGTP